MRIYEMLNVIQKHPIADEIGMGRYPGFPYLRICGERLLIRFYYHGEYVTPNGIAYFKPAYLLEFQFPGHHLVRFENLAITQDAPVNDCTCCMEGAAFLQKQMQISKEIYAACDKVLAEADVCRIPSEDTLRQYGRKLAEGIRELGLASIYPLEE